MKFEDEVKTWRRREKEAVKNLNGLKPGTFFVPTENISGHGQSDKDCFFARATLLKGKRYVVTQRPEYNEGGTLDVVVKGGDGKVILVDVMYLDQAKLG